MLKKLTPNQAFEKIKYYCAYQERAHDEVKQKLYGYGLYQRDVEEIIAKLIEENYLNEERFAVAFAGGKFRIKHWGRIKITYELKLKKVSSYNIKLALKAIDEADYQKTLRMAANKKWISITSGKAIEKRAKTYAYLAQRGFESSLINEVLNEIKES